jgi:hypothetical protein
MRNQAQMIVLEDIGTQGTLFMGRRGMRLMVTIQKLIQDCGNPRAFHLMSN